MQRQPEEEEEKLQTKGETVKPPAVPDSMADRLHTLQGVGSPLAAETRSFFEPRFGYDFSRVRVHSGSESAKLARSVCAQAFTYGRDIYFGTGKYSLGESAGKQLLAHELTHVLQQGAAGPQSKD